MLTAVKAKAPGTVGVPVMRTLDRRPLAPEDDSFVSMVAMPRYVKWSLEELRVADYGGNFIPGSSKNPWISRGAEA